mmetsp:Transcript_9055/g.22224  ORF Transcript_9055/g.22224 Transcript_9055/m.22224 type:complete len:152 (+) Transcript_9055:687-1142(+)
MHPANIKIVELLRTRSHLLDFRIFGQSRVNELISAALAHISSWKVRIEMWNRFDQKYNWRDMKRNTAALTYPSGFDDYVTKMFSALQKEQEKLLEMFAGSGASIKEDAAPVNSKIPFEIKIHHHHHGSDGSQEVKSDVDKDKTSDIVDTHS